MADARLGAQSSEVLSDGLPARRLAAMSIEALSANAAAPDRRLAAMSSEVLTTSVAPDRRLGSMSVEVLVPAKLKFVGWGVPVSTPTWF